MKNKQHFYKYYFGKTEREREKNVELNDEPP